MDLFTIIVSVPLVVYIYSANYVFFSYLNPQKRNHMAKVSRVIARDMFFTSVAFGLLYVWMVSYGDGPEYAASLAEVVGFLIGIFGILLLGPAIVYVRSRDFLRTMLYTAGTYTALIILVVLLQLVF